MPSSLCYLYWSHAPPLLNKSCTPWFIDGTLSERQRMRDVLCPPTIRLLMSHLTWSNPRWQNLTGIRHNPLRNNQPFSRGGCFCEHSSTAVCKQPDIPFHTEKAVAYWDELQSELGLFATFTDYEADARVGTEWVQLGDWATRFRFGALDLTVEMQFWIDAFHQTLEAEAARDQLLLLPKHFQRIPAMEDMMSSFAEHLFGRWPNTLCMQFAYVFVREMHRDWCCLMYQRWAEIELKKAA